MQSRLRFALAFATRLSYTSLLPINSPSLIYNSHFRISPVMELKTSYAAGYAVIGASVVSTIGLLSL